MRIRTRYKLFRLIVVLGVIVFAVSLYDIFANDSEWFVYVMIGYGALALLALILYIGYKPDLDEEVAPLPVVAPAPAPVPEQDVVTEVAPPKPLDVKGPHDFRCPFCANVFALELTHLQKEHELRMNCPYCANSIRVPRRPKLAPGQLVNVDMAAPSERAVFNCNNCGEFLRYTAPGTRPEDRVTVRACPHCGADAVVPAAVGGGA